MPLPEKVLIDTSAFYALASSTDAFHGRAKQAYELLIDREQTLWTTSYVFVETMALVRRRLGFPVAQSLVESMRGMVEILWIDSGVHNAAWEQLVGHQGSGLSFVDWTTALTARQMGAHVFTFDQGFSLEGIPITPR